MKKSKILLYGFLLISLLLPYIAVAHAAEPPKYLGVNEGQEITWLTEFDKGPLEDYLEDRYPWYSETQIELAADALFDIFDWDDDVVAWRFFIDDIKKEKDTDYNATNSRSFDEEDVDYVKFLVNMYETEDLTDPEGWDDFNKLESFRVYEAQEKVYADMLISNLYYMGLGFYHFFIPGNLHYDDVVDEVDDYYEDHESVIKFWSQEEWSVGTEETRYFLTEKEVGIDTNVESTNAAIEDFDSTAKFTNDGILYYYEWEYDGDTIAKFELSQFGFSVVYIIENWWWMALIAGAVIVGLIVLICIIVVKKRK